MGYAKPRVRARSPAYRARPRARRPQSDCALDAWLVDGVEHVGPAAVPGLAAKPIIDLMASLARPDAVVDEVSASRLLGRRHGGMSTLRSWTAGVHRDGPRQARPVPASTGYAHLTSYAASSSAMRRPRSRSAMRCAATMSSRSGYADPRAAAGGGAAQAERVHRRPRASSSGTRSIAKLAASGTTPRRVHGEEADDVWPIIRRNHPDPEQLELLAALAACSALVPRSRSRARAAQVGGRLDDAAGRGRNRVMVVTDGSGDDAAPLLVPIACRGAARRVPTHASIGTTEHGVLRHRGSTTGPR